MIAVSTVSDAALCTLDLYLWMSELSPGLPNGESRKPQLRARRVEQGPRLDFAAAISPNTWTMDASICLHGGLTVMCQPLLG